MNPKFSAASRPHLAAKSVEYPGRQDDLRKIRDLTIHLQRMKIVVESDWLDFGEDDPFLDAASLMFPCTTCKKKPELRAAMIPESERLPGSTGAGFQAHCMQCGASGHPQVITWRAAIAWNKSSKSLNPSRRDLPFFRLGQMTDADAFVRLTLLHETIVTRNKIYGLRIRTGENIGNSFRQRMLAYDAWAHITWKLLFSSNPPMSSDAYKRRLRAETKEELVALRKLFRENAEENPKTRDQSKKGYPADSVEVTS